MKLWLYPLKILRIIRKEYSEVTVQEVPNCAEGQIKSLIQCVIVYLGNLSKKPVDLSSDKSSREHRDKYSTITLKTRRLRFSSPLSRS